MDLATGLMLTATAIYQQAEYGQGEVAFLTDDGGAAGGAELGAAAAEERRAMQESVRRSYAALEAREMRRAPQDRARLYMHLRRAARGLGEYNA